MASFALPRALVRLIEELGKLPGVGPRTAERYAYYLLRREPQTARGLAEAITQLHSNVKQCPKTFALMNADEAVSPLYADPARNKQLVAVVEEPLDIIAIERTGNFKGTYHVLGGAISPLDGIGPEQLHVDDLLERLHADEVQEVILATNASVEGESTALFLQRHIQQHNKAITVSRLARGIPVGIDLEYADQITLSHALEGRRIL